MPCPGFGKTSLQHSGIVNTCEELPGVGWGREGDSWSGKKCFSHSTRHARAPNQPNTNQRCRVRAALRCIGQARHTNAVGKKKQTKNQPTKQQKCLTRFESTVVQPCPFVRDAGASLPSAELAGSRGKEREARYVAEEFAAFKFPLSHLLLSQEMKQTSFVEGGW